MMGIILDQWSQGPGFSRQFALVSRRWPNFYLPSFFFCLIFLKLFWAHNGIGQKEEEKPTIEWVGPFFYDNVSNALLWALYNFNLVEFTFSLLWSIWLRWIMMFISITTNLLRGNRCEMKSAHWPYHLIALRNSFTFFWVRRWKKIKMIIAFDQLVVCARQLVKLQ